MVFLAFSGFLVFRGFGVKGLGLGDRGSVGFNSGCSGVP